MLAAIIAGCTAATAENSPSEEKAILPTFAVTAASNDTLNYTLNLSGELKPYDEVTLYSKIEGFVHEIYVDRGDNVKKGDLLAIVDAPEVEQRVLVARGKEREILEKLRYSMSNYERIRSAADVEGAISKRELEEARSAFRVDSAAYKAVKAEAGAVAQLASYREIRAPFDGVITRRIVSAGALAGSGKSPLFDLAREDRLRLVVAVPSRHAGSIGKSSRAEFSLASVPGKIFAANLTRSGGVVDPGLRSILVEFDVDNSNFEIDAGMYARVKLLLARNYPTVRVPVTAVVDTPTRTFVAVSREGIVDVIDVERGITDDGLVEVFGDIRAGDYVVTEANSTLREGIRINTR